MTEATEESAPTFGKGTRVRITTGDAAGVEGEIFWWGRSKWGYGMRAGVKADGADDKHWVDAAELVAIDADGNELDPQPAIASPSFRTEIEIRGIDVPYALGRLLTGLRIHQGLPRGRAASATVRLDRLRATEIALGCRIPDPVVAYVMAGVGSLRDIPALLGLNAGLREKLGVDDFDLVAFDSDHGDYLTFRHDAPADDATYVTLRHDGSALVRVEGELEDYVSGRLGPALADLDRATPPLEIVVDYVTTTEPAAPEEPREEWVSHKSFGRGVVVGREATSKGDKLTIRFADGETRKLLANFVQFE